MLELSNARSCDMPEDLNLLPTHPSWQPDILSEFQCLDVMRVNDEITKTMIEPQRQVAPIHSQENVQLTHVPQPADFIQALQQMENNHVGTHRVDAPQPLPPPTTLAPPARIFTLCGYGNRKFDANVEP